MRIKLLKQKKCVLRSFSHDELRRMLSDRPKKFSRQRVQVLTYALIDTGCRIDELLSLRREGLDFDNLMVKVTGKGDSVFCPLNSTGSSGMSSSVTLSVEAKTNHPNLLWKSISSAFAAEVISFVFKTTFMPPFDMVSTFTTWEGTLSIGC